MAVLLKKSERVILGITIFVIFFGIGFNFLLRPLLKKNESLNEEISITQAKLKKYARLLGREDYIKGEYEEVTGDSGIFAQKEDTVVAVLTEIELLAQSANIRIVDIRPEAGLKNPRLKRGISVDLRTEGDIEGYIRFIYSLENSFAFLRIKRFQLNAKPHTQILEGVFSITSE